MKKILNKNLFLFFSCILLLNFISASCNSSQININTASAEELDKIINVGNSTAYKIIANRTYNSVDDLIRVRGIGEITLNEIKSQGLACVEEGLVKETVKNDTINEAEKEIIKTEEQPLEEIGITNAVVENSKIEPINLTPIALNIKSEDNKEILKRNLPFYGIISFCVIFGVLFLLNKTKNRNEFRQ